MRKWRRRGDDTDKYNMMKSKKEGGRREEMKRHRKEGRVTGGRTQHMEEESKWVGR